MRWAGTGWKMNHTLGQARAYAAALRATTLPACRMFVLPPFTALATVCEALAGTGVLVGGQDLHWADDGPWTGEVSGAMLRDVGATLALVGHSERRIWFHETDAVVAAKLRAAARHGLRPILCVGDTAAERAAGRHVAAVLAQLRAALDGGDADGLLVAYEPVWAIGAAGTPATPDDVAEMHAALRAALPADVPLLYGGSVTSGNAGALAAVPHVDGLFAGRAAWHAEGLVEIAALVAGSQRSTP